MTSTPPPSQPGPVTEAGPTPGREPPPGQVWRLQDEAEQATGVDACPAGWPRPQHDGLPLPWVTPVLDRVAYWAQIHGGRLLACQHEWLCQVCGLGLPVQALVLANTDGELVTDAGLHRRCALLSLTVCEGLSPSLLVAQVTRADLRHKGHPLAEQPDASWQRWELAPQVHASAPRVGTPAAARLLEPHRHPSPAEPASTPAHLPTPSRSRP
ncbi:hypothetical protein HD597_000451 [Nonomuraea thailandensis]|uniref:Uncharacterized protein n=1 Tax=Nonomuraea thailandensis TaxID=1188745 RepID=A0A9X2GDP2_9ACTN|nr:hypothetical protein [Nonomuraea thailandensis]MCP2353431.1 hypothetical protein [Nonomuraea thailandensis]